MTTIQSSTILYIEAADGVRYAYRRLGLSTGIPLVLHGFFRSNMDFWDPTLVNALAAARPVILFDQAGVGRSTGTVPTTYQGWADCQLSFTAALGLDKFDVLGFSMGGAAAQMVALTAPHLVRKLILAGTMAAAPSDASDVSGIIWPRESPAPEPIAALATSGNDSAQLQHAMAFSFFYDNDTGRAAAQTYLDRLHEPRKEALLLNFLSPEGSSRQMDAMTQWLKPNATTAFDQLRGIKIPVLVMNGDNDVLVCPSYSWELAVKIPRAQLVIYPRAGHGFVYQFAELVAAHINLFLDGDGGFDEASKL